MRVFEAGLVLCLLGLLAASESARAQTINLDGKVIVEGEKKPRAKSKSASNGKPKPKAKSASPSPTPTPTPTPSSSSTPPAGAAVEPSPTPATGGLPSPAPEAAPPRLAAAPVKAGAEAPPPLQLSMFVDAYVAWQSSGSGTLATLSGHRAFSGQGATLRAENGFALAFLGFDASYQTPRFGATASLRFGEGAPIYHVHPDSESDFAFGVDLLSQAYLTWRPIDPLALDLGMFSTPFGAELLESWKNLEYTRGALYYYAQPAWHTGLRLTWDFSESWSATGFIANGTNNLSETQQGSGLDQTPTLGAQLGFVPWPVLSLAAGGLFALDGVDNDDGGFDALADLVATLELGAVRGVFNADYILTRDAAPDGGDRHFLGFSGAAGYAFNPVFGVAARAELLLDDANFDGGAQNQWRLFTATLTADFKPLPATPNLIVRWENRWEESNQDIFGDSARGTADTVDDTYSDVWFESVLGVVVTTAP